MWVGRVFSLFCADTSQQVCTNIALSSRLHWLKHFQQTQKHTSDPQNVTHTHTHTQTHAQSGASSTFLNELFKRQCAWSIWNSFITNQSLFIQELQRSSTERQGQPSTECGFNAAKGIKGSLLLKDDLRKPFTMWWFYLETMWRSRSRRENFGKFCENEDARCLFHFFTKYSILPNLFPEASCLHFSSSHHQ